MVLQSEDGDTCLEFIVASAVMDFIPPPPSKLTYQPALPPVHIVTCAMHAESKTQSPWDMPRATVKPRL